jgi:hypothetical protein
VIREEAIRDQVFRTHEAGISNPKANIGGSKIDIENVRLKAAVRNKVKTEHTLFVPDVQVQPSNRSYTRSSQDAA